MTYSNAFPFPPRISRAILSGALSAGALRLPIEQIARELEEFFGKLTSGENQAQPGTAPVDPQPVTNADASPGTPPVSPASSPVSSPVSPSASASRVLGGVDVYEDKTHVHVVVDLPGFAREQLDVTLDKNTLTISAERVQPVENPDSPNEYLLNERRFGRFTRSFALPTTVDHTSADVSAKLDQGVLHISINKKELPQPRKIVVG